MKNPLELLQKSIKVKLLLSVLLIVVVTMIMVTSIAYYQAKKGLQQTATNQLTSILSAKKRAIEDYFTGVKRQILTLAADPTLVQASKEFSASFNLIGEDAEMLAQLPHARQTLAQHYATGVYPRIAENLGRKANLDLLPHDTITTLLQNKYIAENPNPVGSKHELTSVEDFSMYSFIHKRYHPNLRNYQDKFGFYDIFIIDPETGYVVYSVFKEVDYATNLFTGPYAKSNLAEVFNSARNLAAQQYMLVDFKSYAPSYFVPASFIAAPIFDGDVMTGILVFQLPIDKINTVMTGNNNWHSDGLGLTGGTYLIGDDSKMRSNSRQMVDDKAAFLHDLHVAGVSDDSIALMNNFNSTILLQHVSSEATREVLQGQTGTRTIKDFSNTEKLSAFAPLTIDQLNWGILSEINTDEAFETIGSLRYDIILSSLVAMLLCFIYASFFARRFIRPIVAIEESVQNLSDGTFPDTIRIPNKDELGHAASALNTFVDRLKHASEFASNIGKGMLDANYNGGEVKDVLGVALLSMRDNLKEVAQEEAHRNWITTGLAQFSEIIRHHTQNSQTLADHVLTGLIRYLDANQGAIYLRETDAEGDYVNRIATYAWGRKKYETERLAIGEGLVGQCVLEGVRTILTDVPSSYVKITSGLGAATPGFVGIFPLKLDDAIIGVLEIASMKPYQAFQIELIEKLCSTIATTVHNSQINEQTKRLLFESKELSEELRAQEEELRQSQEELQATQEELSRKLDEALRENEELKNQLGKQTSRTHRMTVPINFIKPAMGLNGKGLLKL